MSFVDVENAPILKGVKIHLVKNLKHALNKFLQITLVKTLNIQEEL
ncbi:MAG: hypothetical protein CM15mP22_0830 [Gammaproteobacteria bacterium]|nr:MAG: hypothetical protein CM15mP22_0830 [Gammaproteobacteria bacterium]